MKMIWLIVAFWAISDSHTNLDQETIHRLAVHPSSTLAIHGKTNVNTYECSISEYNGTDTLSLKAKRGKGAVFTKGQVQLKASEFDCGMKLMTKDFGETIKADQYPFITIDFISFERMPHYELSEEKFMGKLTISIADVKTPMDVRCGIVKGEDGFIHLRGSHKMKFSDFNLTAPSRMLGAVKVEERINVNFHLVLSLQKP
ncbi:MAG TPA: YceI family protein [Chryseolinea sp.]